ncbi:hypothetical protein [Erythrobacter phage vB_EliS-L02]|nr:hypothetical protein [Erythrobacter phage vB_EliS-L02]
MPRIYSGEVLIAATVYVKAETAEEAQAEIARLQDEQRGIEFSSRRELIGDDLWMTGEAFSEDLPDVSLSPAMTIQKSASVPQVWVADDLEGEVA